MSKALEALERIEVDMEYVTRLDFVEPIVRGEVQQDLYRIYHREEKDLDIIKKELKILENIKENLKYGYVFIGYDKDNKPLFQFADTKLNEEIKKNENY